MVKGGGEYGGGAERGTEKKGMGNMKRRARGERKEVGGKQRRERSLYISLAEFIIKLTELIFE